MIEAYIVENGGGDTREKERKRKKKRKKNVKWDLRISGAQGGWNEEG